MQKNPVLRSLENFVPKEFLDILREESSYEEKMTAIYTKALEPDFFRFYRPSRMPSCPPGWAEEYQLYVSLKPQEKSSVWREMQLRFSGYMRSLEIAKAESLSNKSFLTDMYNFFDSKNMPFQKDMVNKRLLEFGELGMAA